MRASLDTNLNYTQIGGLKNFLFIQFSKTMFRKIDICMGPEILEKYMPYLWHRRWEHIPWSQMILSKVDHICHCFNLKMTLCHLHLQMY